MNIIKVTPRGYCYGVVKSIKMAKDARKAFPTHEIYMLGNIVHNQNVVNELAVLNIKVLTSRTENREQLLDSIPNGSVVILSAHGSSLSVKTKAQSKDLIIIDTECEWVTKSKDIIKEHLSSGHYIIFVGVINHPETVAITSLDSAIQLITKVEDIDHLAFPNDNQIFVTNQTTLSKLDLQNIYTTLQDKFGDQLIIENDLCSATLDRQNAVLALKDQNVDLLIVVGDEMSNNTNKLVEIGNSINIPSVRISSVDDIKAEWLENKNTIAISAGASTPTIIQMRVIKFLEQYAATKNSESDL